MGELDSSVAVITGAARGQGRSHAVALAQQGADVIAIDICADNPAIPYPLGTPDDLAQTVALVQAAGGRAVPVIADVRDLAALEAGVATGVAEFGDIDIVIANAGVVAIGNREPHAEDVYKAIVDTNLNGVWHTLVATVPSMIRKGRGGSIVLVSSSQGLTGRGGDGSAAMFGYAAAKHGVVGLMRSAASAFGPHKIRVNSVHPGGVATPMILNEFVAAKMMESPNPSVLSQALLPDAPIIDPQEVTEAVLWLVGPHSKFVTGVALPVDAGHVAS